MPEPMDFLKRFRKDKEAWEQLMAWLNKLDVETVQRYDAAKDYNEWLLAKGARMKLLEIKSRLTREDT